MNISLDIPQGARSVGYRWLSREFGLDSLPHHVVSFVGPNAERHKIESDGIVTMVYPKRTKIDPTWLGHLEFAIRREGLHLDLLRQLFPKVDATPLVQALTEQPHSMYLRKIWYLYESLTGQLLLLPDLEQGNYVDLLDPAHYYTSFRYLVKRQRINQNLLGDLPFCGIVRRTRKLDQYGELDLPARCREIIADFSPEMFQRAMNFLYRKETKSSFEIEREKPEQRRMGKFVELLEKAASGDFLERGNLIALQNLIVDPRFANTAYRDEVDEQIYVGQSLGFGKELVHYIGPKPDDTPLLMDAWELMSDILTDTDDLHPVIAAAIISFGFVFIHPFSDGNGRIHRFLIHHVLARRGFAPEGVIFPVSAVMLKREQDYDAALEAFSKPLLGLIDYELDSEGRMTVEGETIDHYRSIDFTTIAETLFEFVIETIETELPGEFDFLRRYDAARLAMRDIVDLPDRIADLFIRLVNQNHGRLAKRKRQTDGIDLLTDDEVEELERAVREAFDPGE